MGEGFQREAMTGRVADFEERLAEVFGRVPDGQGTQRLELRRAGDDHVSIARVLCDGPRRGALHPESHHLVVIVGDGDAVFTRDDGCRSLSRPAEPVILTAGMTYSYVMRATRVTLLLVSDRALRTRAEECDVTPPKGALPQPESDDDRRALIMLVRDAGTVIASADADVAARRAAVNDVLDALLRTTPSTGQAGDLRGHVAVADQWIRYRLQETITTADIADAVGIGIRTLQQAFQDELGRTPTEYVRERRLEQVREALLDAAEGDTVGSIARRWGFHHLGRFSGAYNDFFGEHPRITLAQSRRRASEPNSLNSELPNQLRPNADGRIG